MLSLLFRSVVIWLAILATAIANGAFREGVLIPRMGETMGRAASTLLLSLAVIVVTWLTIGWIRPATSRDTWMIGGFWLALTLAFEFLGGHYLFGTPWRILLADYNVFNGRIWPLVLVTTFFAPALVARLKTISLR
jgi:hypothetical protein